MGFKSQLSTIFKGISMNHTLLIWVLLSILWNHPLKFSRTHSNWNSYPATLSNRLWVNPLRSSTKQCTNTWSKRRYPWRRRMRFFPCPRTKLLSHRERSAVEWVLVSKKSSARSWDLFGWSSVCDNHWRAARGMCKNSKWTNCLGRDITARPYHYRRKCWDFTRWAKGSSLSWGKTRDWDFGICWSGSSNEWGSYDLVPRWKQTNWRKWKGGSGCWGVKLSSDFKKSH